MPIPIKFNSLYGEPKALVAASPDHLERTFAFPDFGICYRAVASKVGSLGVYDANFYPDGVLYNGD